MTTTGYFNTGQQQVPAYFTAKYTKADVTAATAWTTGNSPITLFTVTGTVRARIYGYSTAAMTSTATTGTLSVGISGAVTLFLGTTTINGTNFPTAGGEAWVDTSSTAKAELVPNSDVWYLLVGSTNVILTIATNSMTAGGMVIVCDWVPVSAGATVVGN